MQPLLDQRLGLQDPEQEQQDDQPERQAEEPENSAFYHRTLPW
jgi:hypothetical protein